MKIANPTLVRTGAHAGACLLLGTLSLFAFARGTPSQPPATTAPPQPAGEPSAPESAAAKPALPENWIGAFQWRCIGPANMGGRITAFAVYEKDPASDQLIATFRVLPDGRVYIWDWSRDGWQVVGTFR